MLQNLVTTAEKRKLRLSPLIGVACPGNIMPDGSIERGAQNLPGNWESRKFNLATELSEAFPVLGGHPSHVIMHNDAVVQGLAEAPFMRKVCHWGVLTIGTGLGNARFTNRHPKQKTSALAERRIRA
jgi:predicted NBD/HSP70 family sugar kinase